MKDLENIILIFLKKIEVEEIKLKKCELSIDVYDGNIKYIASNGWEIVIFCDAGTWDYIDCIKMNNNYIDFDELDLIDSIRLYEPPIDVVKKIYGIPV